MSNKEYTINKFLGIDKNIKTPILKWGHLFNIGITLEEASIRHESKFYKKIRTYLGSSKIIIDSQKKLYEFLIEKEFNDLKAKEITKIFEAEDIEEYDLLMNDLIETISKKNVEVDYYTYRGWKLEESLKRSKEFFRKGNLSIQNKRCISPLYDEWYKLTRKKGAEKSHIFQSNEKESYTEKEIKNILSKKYRVKKFYSPCVHSELNQLFKRKNFIHDMLINDKFIIEYNGSYWHKDFVTFPDKFSIEDYIFEIKKAYNCLELIPRGKKYLIVWENDFNNIDEIIDFIEKTMMLNTDQLFFSSRDLDISLYNEYYISQEKQKRKNNLFKDIVERFSIESHCESKKVAAIAVKNGRIIATGINGSISGLTNCDEYWKKQHKIQKIKKEYLDWIKTPEWREQHHIWSNSNEVHAEQSLIAEAAKNGINLSNVDIYISLQPCQHCSKLLAALQPSRIYYINDYDRSDNKSKLLLNNAGIILEKI